MVLSTYIIPILMLCVAILTLGVTVYALVKAYKCVNYLIQLSKAIFEPDAEGQPSVFGQVLASFAQNIGVQVGSAVNHSLQSSLGGTMKGAVAELESKAIQENPNAAFLSLMPKSIQKSPLASLVMSGALNNVLGGLSKGVGNNNHGSNTGSTNNQSQFDL